MTTPNRLTDADLARMLRLCEAATPGPWKAYVEGRDHLAGSSFIQTAGKDIEFTGATADFDFIASARQDVALLIDEVRALKAELVRRDGAGAE
ncbi:MAG: hypothetical protein MUF34_36150 [Polyangiaceae bacterium]|jgi:hypothetical protein|nr:hypothetical protein [Polyangiaceae bacterium]